MPNKVLGYGRVSTLRQEQEGTSLEEQAAKNLAYAKFLCAKDPSLALPPEEQFNFIDAAVTSDLFMMERPAGAALFACLHNGDHVVISLFDRAFRSSADLESVLKLCRARQIRLYILDLPVDVNTNEGELILSLIACVKRYEKQNIKERITRGIHWSFANGRPTIPPLGWKFTEKKIGKYRGIVEDREYREQVAEIVRLKEEEQLSDRQVYARLLSERKLRTRAGHNKKIGGSEWSLGAIQRAYRAAKAGYPLPPSKWAPCGSASETTVGPSTATPWPPPAEDSCSSPVVLDQPPA